MFNKDFNKSIKSHHHFRSCGDGFKLLLPNPDALTCYGAALQVFPCNLGACPHDCSWSPWSPWSACTPAPSRHRWGSLVSDINFQGVLFSGAVLKETKVRELLPSILAACLATRSIITEVTMVTMAPTMLSRWRLLPAMEPLCWEEPWCVSRGGAG